MSSETPKVVFIGNARCYHTLDWYRSISQAMRPTTIPFATDLIDSEGHAPMVTRGDKIIHLYNIDWLLGRRQSKYANFWRNFIKAVMAPIQVFMTGRINRRLGGGKPVLFHAHTMYYMWVCAMARVKYVGTPQGSEILVRPRRSAVYRFCARRALSGAIAVTVDSESMRKGVLELCGRDAYVIQNGIDVSAIQALVAKTANRMKVLSSRGVYPLYRIHAIVEARNSTLPDTPLTFIYPSWEDTYKESCRQLMKPGDAELGRLTDRMEMYRLLTETKLVVSIPESDSSPRSVYEAIFCGCCVAATYNPYMELLPGCMRARIALVDLKNPNWLKEAMTRAEEIVRTAYEPSEAALDLFDQHRSAKRIVDLCYR